MAFDGKEKNVKKRDFFVHLLSTVFLDSKLAWSSSIYVKVLSLITNTKWFTIEWVSHEMLNIIPWEYHPSVLLFQAIQKYTLTCFRELFLYLPVVTKGGPLKVLNWSQRCSSEPKGFELSLASASLCYSLTLLPENLVVHQVESSARPSFHCTTAIHYSIRNDRREKQRREGDLQRLYKRNFRVRVRATDCWSSHEKRQ